LVLCAWILGRLHSAPLIFPLTLGTPRLDASNKTLPTWDGWTDDGWL